MIVAIVYILIGLISGFFTFWLLYRNTKADMIRKASENKYRTKPTHDAVKAKVVEKEILPIILSILFWPCALFVVYPLMGLTIGAYFLFNWIIDRVEGRKFDDNTTKG